MKVQIEGQLYLESDERQFVIKQYNGKVDDKGKELFQAKGYFSSIEGAIKHLVKMKLMESTSTTLGELLREIESIKGYIESKVTI
ncbi:hypothetical protein [Paenibacillus vini]|uniref:DUF5405 domain-containing protein n=1 Tax=Paenibacillus vini TaxID=1476024 RepID=A0ABQ4MIW9_9BACL|nr:hypothetical protein [Paenibacillus vini]GIP55926.1 hypothetical protein J42TS3_49610 [Paenibacillus vini]